MCLIDIAPADCPGEILESPRQIGLLFCELRLHLPQHPGIFHLVLVQTQKKETCDVVPHIFSKNQKISEFPNLTAAFTYQTEKISKTSQSLLSSFYFFLYLS